MVKLLPSADPEFADLTDKENLKFRHPYSLCRADVIGSRGTKFGMIDISGLSCQAEVAYLIKLNASYSTTPNAKSTQVLLNESSRFEYMSSHKLGDISSSFS